MIKSSVFNADLEESVLLVETTVRGGGDTIRRLPNELDSDTSGVKEGKFYAFYSGG